MAVTRDSTNGSQLVTRESGNKVKLGVCRLECMHSPHLVVQPGRVHLSWGPVRVIHVNRVGDHGEFSEAFTVRYAR